MKKMSLQWRLTCIITLYIAVICGCVTMLVYKNGVYYMDSLQEAVDTRGDDQPDDAEEIYISIPEDKWDEFANDFSVQVYNNKADYRKNSLIISAVLALLGGVATYFISGHALRPIRELSDKIEKVQAQNLSDSRIDENDVKNKMNKVIENLENRFITIRAGRANPNILNGIMVDYYGTPTPIQTLATISIPEARVLSIKPFDKSSLKNMEKAIYEANLGIAPTNNGEVIMLTVPELTGETRKDYVRLSLIHI